MFVLQVVLLFRLETWVMSPHIGRTMGGFWHLVICRLMGRQPWFKVDRSLVYHNWQHRWRRWVWSRWRFMSPAARTQLHSSSQPVKMSTVWITTQLQPLAAVVFVNRCQWFFNGFSTVYRLTVKKTLLHDALPIYLPELANGGG